MLNVTLFNLSLLAACGFAFVRGAEPERLVALQFLLAATFGLATQNLHRSYGHVELSLLLIDLTLLFGLIAVALRANRFWPLWVASIHAFAVGVHGVRAYLPDLPPFAYQWIVAKAAYPMLLILLLGCERHYRRVRAYGSDMSWSPVRWG